MSAVRLIVAGILIAAAFVCAALYQNHNGATTEQHVNARQAQALIRSRFDQLVACDTTKHHCDINAHLHTMREYAMRSRSVVEMGVRGVVGTWAFLDGLVASNRSDSFQLGVDLNMCDYGPVVHLGRSAGVRVAFMQADSTIAPIPPRDLLFIDTLHVYGLLRRELARHAADTRCFILLHDTTSDGSRGEVLRLGMDKDAVVKQTGFPLSEVTRGLWPAVEEFLSAHASEWRLHRRYTHTNGLTILVRRDAKCAVPAVGGETGAVEDVIRLQKSPARRRKVPLRTSRKGKALA